jgi:prepilin-type processing-associated H-X9-DG protein
MLQAQTPKSLQTFNRHANIRTGTSPPNPMLAEPFRVERRTHSMPGERDHACGANVAFADGHVDFHKWQYLGRIRKDMKEFVRNEKDRADLIWVLNGVPDAKGQ